jgi:hypothetical protein
MKKIIAYLLCQGFFCLGHAASKILHFGDNYKLWCGIWYPIYNNLMSYSVYWNDIGGFDVWGQPEKQECSCGIPGGCICGHEKQ